MLATAAAARCCLKTPLKVPLPLAARLYAAAVRETSFAETGDVRKGKALAFAAATAATLVASGSPFAPQLDDAAEVKQTEGGLSSHLIPQIRLHLAVAAAAAALAAAVDKKAGSSPVDAAATAEKGRCQGV